jgi:ribosomal protein L37AE/L43A
MKFFGGIFKWLAVLIFSLSVGLLTIIFLSDNPQVNAFLLRVLILLAIGFFGGLFMRLLFRKWFRIFQILFGVITNILAVLIIDFFYESDFRLSFITNKFEFQIPSASDAAQMGVLLIMSLPAILFFRRKKKNAVKVPERSQPKLPKRSFSDRMKPIVYQADPRNWKITLPKMNMGTKTKNVSAPQRKSTSSVQISSPSSKISTNSTHSKSRSSKKKSPNNKIKLPGKRSHHINNDVKLMGEEEHVCPYCLEEVVKNDSRGVMICPECHTWHHQDCWAITGGCGVAHRNEL